jgi:membrane fusion protein, multidrug efflux system
MRIFNNFGLACLIISVALMAACKGVENNAAVSQALAPVQVSRPIPLSSLITTNAVGRLEAADEASLSFRTGGVIQSVKVDIGDQLKRGQLLATLESVDTNAALIRASQQRDQAARDLLRAKSLMARQLVARKVEDDARTALATAEAELAAARFTQRYTSIIALTDGTVLQRTAEPGETIASGQTVLRVSGEAKGWRLKLEVADRDAVKITKGTSAEVRVDAFPDAVFNGVVTRIGGQANKNSGAVPIEISIDDGKAFKSGLVARASISLSQSKGIAIPVEALTRADGTQGEVMLVRDGKARHQVITLGNIEGEYVVVTQGLQVDSQLVVQGAAYVDDGQAVMIVGAQ